MSARHDRAEGYIAENEANRDKLRAPKDGTVCYTNSGGDLSTVREHVAREKAAGRDATYLEATEQGRRIDNDNLWDPYNEKNRALNDRERERLQAKGVKDIDPQPGTERVWGHTSKTYAEEARGRVTVITHNKDIKEGSFFAEHERPTLIRNDKVTHINGVERKELAQLFDKAESAPTPETRKQALQEINAKIEAGDPTRDNALDRDRALETKVAAAPEREAEGPSRMPERQSSVDRYRAAKAACGSGTREATQPRDKGFSKGSR